MNSGEGRLSLGLQGARLDTRMLADPAGHVKVNCDSLDHSSKLFFYIFLFQAYLIAANSVVLDGP